MKECLYLFDYHVHSQHSPDGKMTMDEACKKAISIGLKEIAFTDHIDIESSDGKFHKDELEKYIEDIEKMQEKYKDQLTIKKGMELGLQPKTVDQFDLLVETFPVDFVIASVHTVDGVDPYLREYYVDKTNEESYIKYYEEILKIIKAFDNFDVLGHLDYVKRYSPHKWEKGEHLYGLDLIGEIFEVLIKRKKGIEVNTSGYKHESDAPMPNIEIVKKFTELGGKIITIGSDAHDVEGLGYSFERTLEGLKEAGITHLTKFNQRKPEFVTITNVNFNIT